MSEPIRALIADDERLAREKLRILLDAEPDIRLVGECGNGRQAVSALRQHRPDLLFLDIHMPDMDGFEVLGAISPDETPAVIFTTAYDRYAVKAFEMHALDYLLKPFDQERLQSALNRTRAELTKSPRNGVAQQVLDLLATSKTQPQTAKRFVIKAGGRMLFLDQEDIDWVEAAANYVKINVGKDTHLLRESIGKLSERLDPRHFVRIHRSLLVNVGKIKALQPCNRGEYILTLRNGKELPCSRGYRVELQRVIDDNISLGHHN
jgi:two-component system LytT family response regulator